MSTTNLQDAAAAFANSILSTINSAATKTAGVDVMYFRSTPVKGESDFLFHDYTLYNVEQCPLEIKMMYSNMSYDESSYIFSTLGMDYQSPLTLEIDTKSWEAAVSNDATVPQAGDIIWIPMTEKLWEVASMNPGKTAGQVTSYKLSCRKYQPSAHRHTGDALTEAIDANTVSTEKQYGGEIAGNIQDLVDDPQTSGLIASVKDPYKKSPASKTTGSIQRKVTVAVDMPDGLKVDGHLVARSYYDCMAVSDESVVTYMVKDSWTADDTRCLSAWVNLHGSSDMSPVKFGKVVRTARSTSVALPAGLMEDGPAYAERGAVKLYGVVKDNTLTVPADVTRKLPSNWPSLDGYKIGKALVYTLLKGNGVDGIEIRLISGRFVSITCGEDETVVDLRTQVKNDAWYGIVINMGKSADVTLYGADPKLKMYSVVESPMRWNGGSISGFAIPASDMWVTNIRLYDTANTSVSARIQDIVTSEIPDDSHAIINDSADVHLNMPYVWKEK